MCLFPISAARQEFGRPKLDPEGDLRLPCGTCQECIKKRAIDWALRARHEMSLHRQNCFITLTYNDQNLPSSFIIKADFQNFLKSLRQTNKLRYMVSYEYGTKTFRPHMHAILFGYNPSKQKFLKYTQKGEALFTSPIISKHWDKGFHSIGTANEKTAYYIASYALKGKKHTITHPTTGEQTDVCDKMDSSRRPGIGLDFLKTHAATLVAQGKPLPRYYQKKLKELFPELYEKYENSQLLNLKTRSAYEKYSKFCIDTQKSQINSQFRENDIDKKSQSFLLSTLQHNRDFNPS